MVICDRCNNEIKFITHSDKFRNTQILKNNKSTIYKIAKKINNHEIINLSFVWCTFCNKRYLLSISNELIRKNFDNIQVIKYRNELLTIKLVNGLILKSNYRKNVLRNLKAIEMYTICNLKETKKLKKIYGLEIYSYDVNEIS